MIRHSYILLPCHSLEDFPIYHTGDDADSILANWTALWHPRLLAQTESTPQWSQVDSPPEDCGDSVVLVPTISDDQLPTGFADRVEKQQGILIRNRISRKKLVAEIVAHCDGDNSIPCELAEDFLALGYAYLQIQLMARMLRYTTYLDEVHFQNMLVEAAKKAVSGSELERNSATSALRSCYDLLCEERNRFYPMDSFLIDLTLVADTTMGRSLREELSQPHPINLLLDGRNLEYMAAERNESLDQIRSREAGSISIVSGQYSELPTQLLSIESLRSQVASAQNVLGSLLDQKYRIFARRRYGLGNRWPLLLKEFGFAGAIHATMDEGQVPEGSHPNIRWEGVDGEAIDAIGRPPLSAESPEGFINLGVTIGESLDSAHTATLVFAHWPGKTCTWFDDLKRISRYADVLGKFMTLDEYFQNISDPGFSEEFTADQYSTPFLAQAIIRKQPNPISRSVWYWQNEMEFRSCTAFAAMMNVVARKNWNGAPVQRSLAELRGEIDASIENDRGHEINESCQALLSEISAAVGQALGGTNDSPDGSAILLNPCSFVRRAYVDHEKLEFPSVEEKPVYAADSKKPRRKVIDVPPMGFVRLQPGQPAKRNSSKHAPLVEGRKLRNEFFEMAIDEQTGGIRSVHLYDRRANLFSQQLSMRGKPARQSRGGGEFVYAKMVAEKIEVTTNSELLAEITAQGKLFGETNEGEPEEFAAFVQKVRLVRGQRVIELEVEIQPKVLPKSNPWNSYYCSRIAWPNESAILYRAVNEARNAVPEKRFESPQYVDIDDAESCVTMIAAGLPFHRKVGYRKLDSILITAGETARQFRFGIGVNLKNPAQQAIDFISPLGLHTAGGKNAGSEFAFLFHIDKRNVIATFWEALLDDDGNCRGVRVRLNETQNRSGKLTITTPFPVTRCQRVDFVGDVDSTGSVEAGKACFQFAANEYFEVEIYWKA